MLTSFTMRGWTAQVRERETGELQRGKKWGEEMM
jgi:hypothetical protein